MKTRESADADFRCNAFFKSTKIHAYHQERIKNLYDAENIYRIVSVVEKFNELNLVNQFLPGTEVTSINAFDNLDESIKTLKCHQDKNKEYFLLIFRSGMSALFMGSKIDPIYLETGFVEEECMEKINNEINEKRNCPPNNPWEAKGMAYLGNEYLMAHTVCFVIDHEKKEIFYKDPYGEDLSLTLRDAFNQHETLRDYTIKWDSTKQQNASDHCNCFVISQKNMQSMLFNEDFISLPIENYISTIENIRVEMINMIDNTNAPSNNMPKRS